MAETERSIEVLEAGIQGALILWSRNPEGACRECGRLGLRPKMLRSKDGPEGGWEVVQSTAHLEVGWLRLLDYPKGSDAKTHDRVLTLLCPECRKKRSL